jgi:hypothetical protein
MRSIEDVQRFFAQPQHGTVETGVAQGWRLIHHWVPDIRAVVVCRPVADAVRSMIAAAEGIVTYDEAKLLRLMEYGDRMLSQISALPGVLTIEFDALATEGGCAAIFEHCLPYQFDRAWWAEMRDRNVQVDLASFFQGYFANRGAVENFKSVCYAELRRLRRSGELRR